MIKIRAKQQRGFWRCGVFHPFAPVEHADDRFTAEELAILKAEPMLTVAVVDGDAPDTAEDTASPVIARSEATRQSPPAPAQADPELEIQAAAKLAIDHGDVTADGKPQVAAIEDILERNISAADRDRAWEAIKNTTGLDDD